MQAVKMAEQIVRREKRRHESDVRLYRKSGRRITACGAVQTKRLPTICRVPCEY